MTEESSKQTDNIPKLDSILDDGVICETTPTSPKRPRLSPDMVIIKTEPISEVESDDEKLIKLIVKSTNAIRDIQVTKESTITELKENISKLFKHPIEKLCLIFEGQVLKDPDSIAHYKMADGSTVHLVIKSNTNPTASTGSTPFNLTQFGAIPGLGHIGLGSPNFVNVQKQMESALQQNPDLFLQIMDNPFVQSIMENPRFLQQVITSNSQMKEMLEANAELNHVINDPAALRESLRHARNPELIQELIQSRAAEAAADTTNAENKENEAASSMKVEEEDKKKKEDKKMKEEEKKKEEEPPKADGAASSESAGLFTSPPLQNIMREMMENPELVKEMFNAPYMSSMLEGLASNPDVASQIMVNNPIFANSTQDQVRRMLPAFLRQMQNPEMQSFVSNPQAMAAMMNIHQSLDQLQQAAPNVFNMFPGQPPVTSLLSEGRSVPAQNEKNEPNLQTQDTFSLFMRNMVNAMNQTTNMDGPPEERYKGQLEQLQMMGFINKQENLQALMATFGDINSAVQRLLSQVP